MANRVVDTTGLMQIARRSELNGYQQVVDLDVLGDTADPDGLHVVTLLVVNRPQATLDDKMMEPRARCRVLIVTKDDLPWQIILDMTMEDYRSLPTTHQYVEMADRS